MMMEDLFTPKMKLADILTANHNLILMLPRFGIELGFGDKTVEEVCRLYNINTSFFILICNVYSFPDYSPDDAELFSIDMQQLIDFLLCSHAYYLSERLPHIENHLKKIAEKCEPKHSDILKKFFSQYKNEVVNHFDYEENTVFPYIKMLKSGLHSSFQINQFEKNHSNIEDKLEDLTNIIIKYVPGHTLSGDRISVLFDIFSLSTDLNCHACIENKILVPYVEHIEKSII